MEKFSSLMTCSRLLRAPGLTQAPRMSPALRLASSSRTSRWKFWNKQEVKEVEEAEELSEMEMYHKQQEEYRVEAEAERMEQRRNKSRLSASHRQMLRGEPPNVGLRFEYGRVHHSQEFKRKMFGTYGERTDVDPGICWPNDKHLELAAEWEKLYQEKPLIEQINDAKAGIVKRKEDRIAREAAVEAGLARMDAQIKQWKARVNTKNVQAEHERARREKVLAELREEFGYNVNPNDNYMKERIAEREKVLIKEEKEAKKAAKKEKYGDRAR